MYPLFEAGTFILHCFHSSVFFVFFVFFLFCFFSSVFFFFFFFFPAKGIHLVCDRMHLILSFYMNLRIYIGDSSLSVSQKNLTMHTK